MTQPLPTSMRVVLHDAGGPPTCMHVGTVPVPEPKEDEVLIRVAYAGVNRPDCLQRSGRYPPPPGASPYLGLEVAGEVVAVGTKVTSWRAGDRVCGLANGGAYAEYVAIPHGQVLPVPKCLSLLQAAALPENYFTVWTNVFERGRLQPHEWILVHGGSSGIGLTAIQLAHARGAKVICTVGDSTKAQACLSHGADHAIVYRTQDFVEEVKSITQGQGVNLILDMVGGPYLQRNLASLALEGRLVQIAFLQGPKAEVDWSSLMTRRLTFTGSTLRPRTATDKAAIAKSLRQEVWPLLESGQALPHIHATFALKEVVEAHALMESSLHIGKIMLQVTENNDFSNL
ncbi:MAG: Phthiocerol synthesis polyketide synthase type PpsC [Pseudomonadota bacterium]